MAAAYWAAGYPFVVVRRWLLRPSVVLWSSATFLLLVGVGLGIAIWIIVHWSASASDQIAAVAAAVGIGTLALATLAAVVALYAYQVAAQRPKLIPEIKFWSSCEINKVILVKAPPDGAAGIPLLQQRPAPDGRSVLSWLPQFQAWIRVRNERLWSARQPAVTLRLNGLILPRMYAERIERMGGWSIYKTDAPGSVVALRWEGAAIHGEEVRDLPKLELYELRGSGTPTPSIDIEVFAENFRKTFPFPVELLTPEEWDARCPGYTGGGFY
jgi:hypothetical protein